MPPVTRRKLLIGAGAAAALPAGWLAVHANKWRTTIIADYLRGQLPGLAVSDTNLEGFAYEYIERYVAGAGRKVYHEAIFLMLADPVLVTAAPAVVRVAFDKFSRTLITKFLLSTDFFNAAGQQADKATYIGFSDPYGSACSNSLANLEQGA